MKPGVEQTDLLPEFGLVSDFKVEASERQVHSDLSPAEKVAACGGDDGRTTLNSQGVGEVLLVLFQEGRKGSFQRGVTGLDGKIFGLRRVLS